MSCFFIFDQRFSDKQSVGRRYFSTKVPLSLQNGEERNIPAPLKGYKTIIGATKMTIILGYG